MSYHAPTLPEDVRAEALKRLGRLEAQHNVTILFAIESGSRAWGFQSPDSDYDVRGFFVRDRDAYLGLDAPADVINPGIDGLWDIELWDISKALRLLVNKGNATVAEWLNSPLIYMEDANTTAKLRDLIYIHGNPQRSASHYYGLGNGCYQGEIKNRATEAELVRCAEIVLPTKPPATVNYKKYLYALRSAFCISWIDRYLEIPPMTMPQLMSRDIMPREVRSMTEHLLKRKASMGEFGDGPRIEVLDTFIESKLAWVKERGFDKLVPANDFREDANTLLLSIINQKWK